MNQEAFIKEVQQLFKKGFSEHLTELKKTRYNDLFTRKDLAKYLNVSQLFRYVLVQRMRK